MRNSTRHAFQHEIPSAVFILFLAGGSIGYKRTGPTDRNFPPGPGIRSGFTIGGKENVPGNETDGVFHARNLYRYGEICLHPGLTATPQSIDVVASWNYPLCLGLDPTITSAAIKMGLTNGTGACANSLPPFDSLTVAWDNGSRSVITVSNYNLSVAGTEVSFVATGTVTGGDFQGDTVLQTNILACQFSRDALPQPAGGHNLRNQHAGNHPGVASAVPSGRVL